METVSKENIKIVATLAQYIDIRKEAEKKEAELKQYIKGVMGAHSILHAGNYTVLIAKHRREGIDTKLLKETLGTKAIPFVTVVEYETMQIISDLK